MPKYPLRKQTTLNCLSSDLKIILPSKVLGQIGLPDVFSKTLYTSIPTEETIFYLCSYFHNSLRGIEMEEYRTCGDERFSTVILSATSIGAAPKRHNHFIMTSFSGDSGEISSWLLDHIY